MLHAVALSVACPACAATTDRATAAIKTNEVLSMKLKISIGWMTHASLRSAYPRLNNIATTIALQHAMTIEAVRYLDTKTAWILLAPT